MNGGDDLFQGLVSGINLISNLQNSPNRRDYRMPVGIDVLQWVVERVAVTIERLRVGVVDACGVGTDEPAQCRVVLTGFVVVEAGGVV